MLKEGRVQLYVKLPNEGEITLSVIEGGSIFGEIAVCAQGSGKVRARALMPSLVCTLKTEIFEQLIQQHPAVALAIVRMLSDRLRQAVVPSRSWPTSRYRLAWRASYSGSAPARAS